MKLNKWRSLFLMVMCLFMTACDDNVAEMTDEAFHAFSFGRTKAQADADPDGGEEVLPTTLTQVKTQFPKYSQEFVWHKKGDVTIPEYRNQTVLIYRTRNGQFYLHFEDNKLVNKRKYQAQG